jgi:methylmalonyl-CoA epimerase
VSESEHSRWVGLAVKHTKVICRAAWHCSLFVIPRGSAVCPLYNAPCGCGTGTRYDRAVIDWAGIAVGGERLNGVIGDAVCFDHIGIAVRGIAAAQQFYELLGMAVGAIETVEREQVRVAMVAIEGARFELLEPTADDSTIGRFLARRGEGLHHVALRVQDVDAIFARLKTAKVRLASAHVGVGAGGHRYFFVHPSAAGGVLVEIVGGPSIDGAGPT